MLWCDSFFLSFLGSSDDAAGDLRQHARPYTHSMCTETPLLAPRWKYHLSNWPLSRGRLKPRLVWFLFFLVSQFLPQVLSRTFTPPPPFLESAWFLFQPDPGFCRFYSGFTTQFWFMERCAQCWWVSNLFTNPWCGPFHIKRQGISRFAQFASVFLILKYFVPPNRKIHKFSHLQAAHRFYSRSQSSHGCSGILVALLQDRSCACQSQGVDDGWWHSQAGWRWNL